MVTEMRKCNSATNIATRIHHKLGQRSQKNHWRAWIPLISGCTDTIIEYAYMGSHCEATSSHSLPTQTT